MAGHTGKFWVDKSTFGRKPTFEEPEMLWDAACQYFNWIEMFPLWEAKLVSFQGSSTIERVPKMRAMTIGGFCIFADICVDYFWELNATEKYSSVCKAIQIAIREQKFGGAAADLLNASIIARDLGLAERREITGLEGGPIKTENEAPALDKMSALLDKLSQNVGKD